MGRRRKVPQVAVRAVGHGMPRRRLYVEGVLGEGVLLRDNTGFIAFVRPLEVGRLRRALRDELLAASWPAHDPDVPQPRQRKQL